MSPYSFSDAEMTEPVIVLSPQDATTNDRRGPLRKQR